MSTARIVSLVIAIVGFIGGGLLFRAGREVDTTVFVAGQFVTNAAAQQQATMLTGIGIVGLLAAVAGFAAFVALTIRDQNRARDAAK